jgi:hypothetical protein
LTAFSHLFYSIDPLLSQKRIFFFAIRLPLKAGDCSKYQGEVVDPEGC